MEGVSVVAAFSAGLLSFLSPCVLPIIPGYLSMMTGMTLAELTDEDRDRWSVLVPALLFSAGFSFVFVAFGASASAIGVLLKTNQIVVTRIAGVALILFGLLMTGVIPLASLYGEARFHFDPRSRFGRGASFVMGMAFAAGWTPCVGPILGSILALAARSGSALQGAGLLGIYSLGLALPFLVVAVLFGQLKGVVAKAAKYGYILNRVAGVTLMALGALIFFGKLETLGTWLTGAGQALGNWIGHIF